MAELRSGSIRIALAFAVAFQGACTTIWSTTPTTKALPESLGNGNYFGAGVGRTSTTLDSCEDHNGCSMSGTNIGGKVFAGTHFNQYFAIEGSVDHLGKTTESWIDTAGGAHSDTRPMVAVFGHAVGTLPITRELGVLGRVGAGITSDSLFSALGVGVDYHLNQEVALRFEYEQFFGSGGPSFIWHTSLLSASVVYYFRK